MKNYLLILQVVLFGQILMIAKDSEPSEKTMVINEIKANNKLAGIQAGPLVKGEGSSSSSKVFDDVTYSDDEVTEFLLKAADARMMDMQEGQLAKEKGTTSSIQEYGNVMVNDQTAMLKEIRSMAQTRKIQLPEQLSDEKQEGRNELASLDGKEFDKKFIKMMIIDHKRDIRIFVKALDSDDEEISEFAGLFLPLLKSHLARIQKIKSEYN